MNLKIRLLAYDSKIPNYAIMKISTYHKLKGDNVDWYNHILDYEDTDILYISKVFTFSKLPKYLPINSKIIIGGSGYDYKVKLPEEIENCDLDYFLYPKCDFSIIFTTRGCVRNCGFCIVPQKEGLIHNIKIANINPKSKWIMLLDNNFFANKTWKANLNKIREFNLAIDFNTGIDLRLLTEEHCVALSSLKIKTIHCAWDNYRDKNIILPKLKMLIKYVKPYKVTVYVLVGYENKEIIETDIERVMTLKQYGVNPFAMGYVDFNNPKYKKSRSVIDFCRWVNMKSIFKSVEWKDYNKIEKSAKSRGQISLFDL